jgi:hypothetical protein
MQATVVLGSAVDCRPFLSCKTDAPGATGLRDVRKVRRRARYLASGAGFVCVNDAPALAAGLARMITGQAVTARAGPGRSSRPDSRRRQRSQGTSAWLEARGFHALFR